MENSKRKRQTIILSIVAILVLIFVTTATTYAFFTYYRSGTKNQLLVTGRIKLTFTDGVNNINLTNQFPISDADAMATLPNMSGDIAEANFTVSGYAGGSIILQYNVYAIAGSTSNDRTRIPDNHIKLY